jgi:hypothetical protein
VAVLRQPALTVSIISRVIAEQAGAAAVLINCAEIWISAKRWSAAALPRHVLTVITNTDAPAELAGVAVVL